MNDEYLNPPDDAEPEWATKEIEKLFWSYINHGDLDDIGLCIIEECGAYIVGRLFIDGELRQDEGEEIIAALRKRFYEDHRAKWYEMAREEGRI